MSKLSVAVGVVTTGQDEVLCRTTASQGRTALSMSAEKAGCVAWPEDARQDGMFVKQLPWMPAKATVVAVPEDPRASPSPQA